MTTILEVLQQYGLATVLAGLLIYMLVRGEVTFRYPVRRKPTRDDHT